MTLWEQWVRHPQRVWLRRALFQIHLWSGIGVGLYVLVVSVTGSVLVYRNELSRAATPDPVVVAESGPRLTEEQLKDAAVRVYPGYAVTNVGGTRHTNQAVDIWLRRGDAITKRLFDPYTGQDLGNSVPTGIWIISMLLDLHDDLFGGRAGRRVNGAGAMLLLTLAGTGVVIWWPGIRTWRRSLTVRRSAGWQRFNWDLHSMLGFWTLAFIALFAVTGAYLGNPQQFQDLADYLEPLTDANAGDRVGDRVMYWLAFLHFGRFGGRIFWCGRGLCDATLKFVWFVFGLVPAVMAVTGAIMWWNRVLRRRFKAVQPRAEPWSSARLPRRAR